MCRSALGSRDCINLPRAYLPMYACQQDSLKFLGASNACDEERAEAFPHELRLFLMNCRKRQFPISQLRRKSVLNSGLSASSCKHGARRVCSSTHLLSHMTVCLRNVSFAAASEVAGI